MRWVFAHGFTQTHQSWWPLLDPLIRSSHDRFAESPELCLVDLPGHGGANLPTHDGLSGAAASLVALGSRATYVGYSLGGRVALTAACATGRSTVERLVLISATPGIDSEDLREQRIATDRDRSAELERRGVEAFISDWVRLPLFGGFSPSDLTYRTRNTAAGLSASLRHHGTGQMVPLWGRLSALDMPVLLIAGERDLKFVDIAHSMHAHIPNSEVAIIDDAAHAVHLERPGDVAAAIIDWLGRIPDRV